MKVLSIDVFVCIDTRHRESSNRAYTKQAQQALGSRTRVVHSPIADHKALKRDKYLSSVGGQLIILSAHHRRANPPNVIKERDHLTPRKSTKRYRQKKHGEAVDSWAGLMLADMEPLGTCNVGDTKTVPNMKICSYNYNSLNQYKLAKILRRTRSHECQRKF